MKRILTLNSVFCGAMGLLLLAGCMTVPETGRKQLVLISGQQETQLGLTSFNQMKQEIPISKDPAANALVQKVGQRIAAVTKDSLPNAQWEFVVFESKEANAFCLPGGKVGVYTGLLPIAKDEAGLATVIAHEVAHAVAHHGAERMTESMVIQGLEPLAVGGAEKLLGAAATDSKYKAAIATAYGGVTQVGVALPHSRSQESEADHIGLLYMARAGYNPGEAVRFWKRFKDYNAQAGGSTGFSFLRTHPLDDVRIADLQKELPKAMQEYNKAKAAGR